MPLRESGNGNAEISGVMLVNVSDEVDGVHESTRSRLPCRCAGHRVATEGKDVLTPMRFSFLEGPFDLFLGHYKKSVKTENEESITHFRYSKGACKFRYRWLPGRPGQESW